MTDLNLYHTVSPFAITKNKFYSETNPLILRFTAHLGNRAVCSLDAAFI
ncbi:hypothetical protein H3T50_07555 [Commensalibacter sp. M0134]|nr:MULTISPECIES: hypothetical protein [Commensalibacter]MCT6852255.1 hypothetical protein [Commensalibacter sp.]MBI0066526.1 hypothetical protein [Commensalibacter sp. M0134]MBI0070444.1 hypothetical protein [Commensalibacter sp. M0133]MBI0081841.1 hypothetical protein [Commensalibacter melissae]MBI0083540.1 hypothetical protein [Commensalibacter sp. W6292M3]